MTHSTLCRQLLACQGRAGPAHWRGEPDRERMGDSGRGRPGGRGAVPVDVPWWQEVEPVVARLEELLGVPVLVLRLLTVDGGEGGRDGHATYHVEALERPAPGPLERRPLDDGRFGTDSALRAPWARAAGLRELLDWSARTWRRRDDPSPARSSSDGPGTLRHCSGCPPRRGRSGSRRRRTSPPTRGPSSPHSPVRTLHWCRSSWAGARGGSSWNTYRGGLLGCLARYGDRGDEAFGGGPGRPLGEPARRAAGLAHTRPRHPVDASSTDRRPRG